ELSEDTDSLEANFKFELIGEAKFEIYDEESGFKAKSEFGQKLHTPVGEVTFVPNISKKVKTGTEFFVSVSPIMKVVDGYREKIQTELTGSTYKKNNVVTLSLTDNLKEKAERILDELVEQYNLDAVNDKKRIGEKTSRFITERLELISEDLKGADKEVEEFKNRNNVSDLQTETGINLQTSAANDQKLLEYTTQLNLVNYMDEYLQNNEKERVPANIGLDNAAINQTTQQYNQLVLQRDAMLRHSTEKNPIVQNINAQIEEVGQTLRASLNNYKRTT